MAIFHLSIKIVSHGGGKSAVAASAYRAGEKLIETETGYVHDYTKKNGVIHTEVLLPTNAPPEFSNREILWNEVQKIEKQSTAQLAREIEVALPVELSREEQIELVRKYVLTNFVSVGMCADVAIHEKKVDSKRVLHQNPHAHILLTTRAFKDDGTWAPKEKKAYALDENGERIPLIDPATGLQKIGKRNEKMWKRITVLANDWNDQSNAEKWRQSWADMCNLYLAADKQIDNRSFERQGLEQIPTIHEGYVARQMERRGEVSERMEFNRTVKRLNEVINKIKNVVAGIGIRLLKLKDDLQKVRMIYGERNNGNAASYTGRNATDFTGTTGNYHADNRGIASVQSGSDTGTETVREKGQRDNFIEEISDAIKRRKRKIDEALERKKELYERFEQLQKRRADGSTGANGDNARRTGAEGRADTLVTRGTGTTSDLIRMAESAGTVARANDTASRAIVDDSTASRANRDAERKRQLSEREPAVKERKRRPSR